jgi:hypothetical protein
MAPAPEPFLPFLPPPLAPDTVPAGAAMPSIHDTGTAGLHLALLMVAALTLLVEWANHVAF